MSRRTSSVNRGPRPVAPTIRMPASLTRSRTAWENELTVSSLLTNVPSRSVAISFGRPDLAIWCSFRQRGGATVPRVTQTGHPRGQKGLGLEHVPPQERLQRLGYPDRPVGLLVVLHDRNQPAGRGQGAVQRGSRLRLPIGIPVADVEPTALESCAVRRAGHLAVPPLRGHPRLAVELARGRRTEIAGGHVDHAVRDLDLAEHLLFP